MDISNYIEQIEEIELELDEEAQVGIGYGDEDDLEKELNFLKDVQYLVEERHYAVNAIQAWLDLGHEKFDDFEEAYQGKWYDDEEFVEQLCIGCGDVPDNLPSYIYIDWGRTAGDIMMDYEVENSYYFRIL